MADPLLIAKGEHDLFLLPGMANRHGLVAGASGTGKTVTLQVLAESLSRIGVPVFTADVKGDVAGLSQPGKENPKITERVNMLGLAPFQFSECPVMFWDVFGEQGHPIRTTVSDMGPLLLGRILELNDTQTDVLNLVFKIADDNGLLLLDLKDLRAMLQFVGENAADYETEYGRVSRASIGSIQRALLAVETQGGDKLFGEPALNIQDMMQTDNRGRGYINILAANKLLTSPKLYSTMLLWLLSELFEQLPEVGDVEKPKLVFFFDEAHLLFRDAPKALEDKIELVVRLIRSKGVGVYFVTQSPLDPPPAVLGQLGNRIQHALRAFTPQDQKVVRAAAQTFRTNPNLDIETAITELAVGEALVSFLDPKGAPSVTERAYILPPHSQIGAITPDQRQAIIRNSLVAGFYEKQIDRESAYEKLKARAADSAQAAEEARVKAEAAAAQAAEEARGKAAEEKAAKAQARAQAQAEKEHEKALAQAERERERAEREAERARAAADRERARAEREAEAARRRSSTTRRRTTSDPMSKLLQSAANTAGREIVRGLFGTLGGRRR